jgi:hypothetical protein
VWVNNELVHRGDYYAIAKFEDQDWPNMVASSGVLREGWNRIDVAVESWPPPRNKGFGFSVRICDLDNQPVPGLRVADAQAEVPNVGLAEPPRPAFGAYYRWDEVRDDFYHKLPKLGDFPLDEQHAQVLHWTGSIGATQGFVAMGLDADRTGETRGGVVLRELPKTWDRAKDSDTRLDNVLDWNREAVAVYPAVPHAAERGEPQRHYLLLRPEAVDAYLTCLREVAGARESFGERRVSDRVLGYVQVGKAEGDDGVRVLIVAEACLPTPLPADEEDLLSPLAE